MIKDILDLLFKCVIEQGGDGDAFWLSSTPISELFYVIQEYDKHNNIGWHLKEASDHLLWGFNQEWVIITNSKEFFNNLPNWAALKIEY